MNKTYTVYFICALHHAHGHFSYTKVASVMVGGNWALLALGETPDQQQAAESQEMRM